MIRRLNWTEKAEDFDFSGFTCHDVHKISESELRDADYLIETGKRIERSGSKIVGIGIGAEFVNEIYKNAIVVKDFPQITDELFQVMASEFRTLSV